MSARRSRLDRLVARLLSISPDDVRLLLAQQRIRVDGRIAQSRDEMIDGFASVEVDGQLLQQQQRVCVMLHKPAGVLSATRDPRHTVATSLIDHADVETLHIAGRLDLHASGLLLLTNDGRWSRAISDPEYGVSKQYLVRLRDALHEDYIAAFAQGMHFPFEDIVTRPAQLEILEPHLARVTLQEGRYHQLKRMFGRFRNPVLGIHRTAIGALELDPALAPGHWRELTAEEIMSLQPRERTMPTDKVVIPDSDRLRFRLMDSRDAALWFELDQDPEVMRFLNDSKPTSWEQIEQFFIPRVAAFTDAARGHGLWEVRDRINNEYLGWILVRDYGCGTPQHERDNVELGWRFKRHCWGKGIATEAAAAVLQEVRQEPALRKVCAIADPANLASIGVMKKLGMHYVDQREHRTPLRDFVVAYYEMPAR